MIDSQTGTENQFQLQELNPGWFKKNKNWSINATSSQDFNNKKNLKMIVFT